MSEKKQKAAQKPRNARARQPELPSRPFFSRKITLGSHQAQQVYKRGFEVTSDAFSEIGIVLRIVGTEEEAKAVEKVVDDMLDKVSTELKQEKERMQKLLDENGIVGDPQFTDPLSTEAQIFNPRAGRYLSLISEVDSVIRSMTLLWLSGVLTDGQYTNGAFHLQRRLLKISATIRNIARRARFAAYRKRNQAQNQRAKDKEKQKEKAPAANPTQEGEKSKDSDSGAESPVEEKKVATA
ncbi:AcaB family transcriptional regulator [Geoalkalibacter subterraneus]|uniref:DUF1845 domain-containing protein n=1 Tax=Geoalkalibacter subterraneus TaxID=483547 RepID=A0A0B5FVE4_9BACT|nr:AcaB family transcriptional regulator [Geoalkalibacter subterraneus]AJF08150.1 hypothetical protein GSUB_16745 [Geoalkalibacter subterraneus]